MPPGYNSDMHAYQARVRRLLTTVDKLRAAGATLSIQLPTIAVCGNQSAGKSSMLEAICQVPLPRQSGTCTRCSMELRLTEDGEWSATIKLRREYDDAQGIQSYERDRNRLTQPEELLFLEGVTDKQRFEAAVRAAQRALLNPQQPHGKYAAAFREDQLGKLPDDDALKFTKNVVVVELRGAPVNLTLIDLPGIIQSTGDDERIYLRLIQELVQSYIRQGRTIIVAAISCKDDLNNQAIVDLARQADPQGERTIGVLTKPDTIEEGTHQQWIDTMRGNTAPLRLGYFAVRNPAQAELDKQEGHLAREREQQFFATTQPWCDELAMMRGRFGVPALSQELSRQLVALTDRELPKMREAVARKLEEVSTELRTMPPPPGMDQQSDMITMLHALAKRIDEAQSAPWLGTASGGPFNGFMDSPSGGFSKHLHTLLEQFKVQIFTSRPTFIIKEAAGSAASQGLSPPAAKRAATESAVQRLTSAGGNGRAAPAAGSSPQPAAGNTASQQLLGGPEPASGAAASSTAAAPSFSFGKPQSGTPPTGASSSSGIPTASTSPFEAPSAPAPGAASTPAFALTSAPAAGTAAGGPFGGGAAKRSAAISTEDLEGFADEDERQAFASTSNGGGSGSMTLAEVKALIDAHRSRELPTFTPYAALERLIARFQGRWSAHAFHLLEDCDRLVTALLDDQVQAVFGRFPAAASKVRRSSYELQKRLHARAEQQLQLYLDIEAAAPFTLNSHYFVDVKTKVLTQLKQKYHGCQGSTIPAEAAQEAVAALARAGVNVSGSAELYRLVQDPVDDALDMMAACLAYFKVASKRFADYVAMSVQHVFVQAFCTGLLQQLMQAMLGGGGGASADEGRTSGAMAIDGVDHGQTGTRWNLQELLCEDRTVAERRALLRTRQKQLREAQRHLDFV